MASFGSIINEIDIRLLTSSDPIFEEIHAAYGPPPDWQRPPGFISLVRIILEQQVSLASARAHFEKLSGYIPEMTPKQILILSDEEMRKCQISRQKARYLRALSEALLENQLNLESLGNQPEAHIRSQLTAIPGIGVWTSDIYLMFCLQFKDIFPLGDVAIIHAARTCTSLKTREEIADRSNQWQPRRSLASFYLWHFYLHSRNRSSVH